MYALGDTYRLKLEKSASARQREAIVGRVEASCFAGWRKYGLLSMPKSFGPLKRKRAEKKPAYGFKLGIGVCERSVIQI